MPKDNRSLQDVLAENERLRQSITDDAAAARARHAEGPSYALQSEFTPAPDAGEPLPVMEDLIGRQQAEASNWDGKHGRAPGGPPDWLYALSPAMALGRAIEDGPFTLDSNNLPAVDSRWFDMVARQDGLPSFMLGLDREQAREMVDPTYNTFKASMGRPYQRDAERNKFRKDGYTATLKDVQEVAEAHGLGSRYWMSMSDAQSPEDLQALATQYKLREDREFEIAQGMDGVEGFIGRAAVNVMDPTFLMAGGGVQFVARQAGISLLGSGVFGSSRLGRASAGGLQAAGENIVADAPLEAFRLSQDPTYTAGQYALAVGGSAVFGLVLGGAGGALTPQAAATYETSLKKAIYEMGRAGHGDAGARQLNEVLRYTDDSHLDLDADAPERSRWTFGTPLARLARSENATVRGIASVLSWNPMTKGGSGQKMTAWEAKRRIVDTAAVHARPAVDAAKQYFTEANELAITGGMSTQQMDEFFNLVGHHAEMVRTGQDHNFNTNPHVVAAFEALDAGMADTLNYVRGRGYVTGRDAPPPPPARSIDTDGGPSAPEAPTAPEAPEAPTAPAAAAAPRNPYFGRRSFRPAEQTDTDEPTAPLKIEDDILSVAMSSPSLGSGGAPGRGTGPDDWRPIREVRAQLNERGYSDAEVDASLKAMYREGKVNLSINDDQGSLTDADRAASFVLGETRIDLIAPTGAGSTNTSARATPEDTTVTGETGYTYADALAEVNALPPGSVLPREGRNPMQTVAGAARQGEMFLDDLAAYVETAPSLTYNVAMNAGGAALGAAGGAVATNEDLPDELRYAGAIMGALIGGYAGNRVAARRLSEWAKDMPAAGFMVGPSAQGVNLNKLAKARKMEVAGVDRDTIWEKTGWGRMPGEGNGWGSEMTDSMYFKELLGVDEVRTGDVLKMRAIYKAYPKLAETWLQSKAVLSYIEDNPGVGAVVMTNGNTLKNAMIGVDPKLPRGDIISSMQHEVQHLIDMLEKRDPGSTGAGGEYAYLTSAGEAMARNQETRLGMTQRQRAAKGPWHTLDVPEEHIWMSHEMVMGEAASLGSNLRTMQSDAWFDKSVKAKSTDAREFAVSMPAGGEGIDVRLGDYSDDGIMEIEWDWQSNDWSMDKLDKSLAESGEAFAAVQAITERVLKEGADRAYYFEGLEPAHARLQRFMISRRPADDYVAYEMTFKKPGDEPGVMSGRTFGLVKNGEDAESVMTSRRRGKSEYRIENLDEADAKADAQVSESRRPADPDAPTGDQSKSGRPLVDDDGYDGVHEFKDVEHQRGHMTRTYNAPAFNTLMNRFGGVDGVAARLMEPLHRANEARFAEIGARTGVDSYDIALRVATKYVKTVRTLTNQAAQKGSARHQPMHPEYRDAAVEIARSSFNDGDVFPGDVEEAIEMIMDLIAPVKKKTANSNRAKPRIDMMFDPEQDADIMGMFNWNALDNFMSYRSQLSGHAGLLKAGFRSAAELDTMIAGVRDKATVGPLSGVDPVTGEQIQRPAVNQKAAGREADMLAVMRDAIVGVPSEALMKAPAWSFWSNQMRRMNFASVMGNVGFLAVSEVGGSLTATGPGAIFTRMPAFNAYFKMAKSGDPAARDSLYYATDMLMGHGSAQLKARLTRTNNRYEDAFDALADPVEGIQNNVDTFTRKASNLTARWSGMHVIQEYLRSNIAVDGANFWSRAALAGRKPLSDRRMLALGVDDAMWSRISAELNRLETFQSPDTGRPVTAWDVNEWTDAEALNVFINAIDRNTRRVVMEGDLGHLPLEWRSSPFAQLLTQFMNFPISAYSKQLGFAINAWDPKVVSEVILMSLGGAMGYMARTSLQGAVIQDEPERREFIEERLTMEAAWKAAFYYSAHASLLPNAIDSVGQAAKGIGVPGAGPMFSKSRASGLGSDFLTGNPSVSKVDRVQKSLTALVKDGPSQDEVKEFATIMAPLGNHIMTQAALNALFALVPDTEVFPDEASEN